MTRGKHAAQANRQRAAEAQAEVMRLRDDAARWKKLAEQNIARARRTEQLERLLRKARGEQGVPEWEHDQELANIEARWAERWDEAMEAIGTIIALLITQVPANSLYLSSNLLKAMQVLPEDVMREATSAVWNRDEFRTFMQAGAINTTSTSLKKGVIAAAMTGGYEEGKIPARLLNEPGFRKQVGRVSGI